MPTDTRATPDVAFYDTGAVRYRGFQLDGQKTDFSRQPG
jgi:hypothetical protein